MDFIKRNKATIIAIVIFLVLVVAMFQVKNIFFPDEGDAIYGDRLKGIEKVKLSKDISSKVDEKLDESVSKVTVRVAGRIVNIILVVSDDMSVDVAKSCGDKALEAFSDKEKKYYDFQVFVEKKGESNEFPIIGYRHHTKNSFSWTKNRTGNGS